VVTFKDKGPTRLLLATFEAGSVLAQDDLVGGIGFVLVPCQLSQVEVNFESCVAANAGVIVPAIYSQGRWDPTPCETLSTFVRATDGKTCVRATCDVAPLLLASFGAHFGLLIENGGQNTEASGSRQHRFALHIITVIGASISGLACLVTAAVHLAKPQLRAHMDKRVLVHLCLVLGLALVLFASLPSSSAGRGCYVATMVVHYFFVAAFTWMALEGVMLYLLFVRVFRMQNEGKAFWAFLVTGYGLPALVVLATVTLAGDSKCV
jgi:hypothetical protein